MPLTILARLRPRRLLALTAVVLLSACGSSSPGGGGGTDTGGTGIGSAPRVPITSARAGSSYRQEIPVASTGDTIVVQVFEPSTLEAGKSYPLILHSHGYGGSRLTTPDAFAQRLIDNGYYLISIDQRGFGQSSDTVRVMSPDFEGQDLIAVLDWAENLPGLRRRASGEMLVGSYGGSYGGMYQLLLNAVDPQHRLRVMAPDITPHDLTYALNPNEVVKSGWGLALVGAGELPLIGLVTGSGSPLDIVRAVIDLAARGQQRQDPAVYETLVSAAVTNEFSDAGFNFMRYHSVRYFCDGIAAGPQDFVLATPDPRAVPPTAPPPADVLLTQGFRDTLFNFNDGLRNYECLKARGGDVRLLTHQSGHILPLSVGTLGIEDALDPFYAALTLPGFQDAGGSRSCGSLDLDAVQFAWFEEKLQNKNGAIDAVLTSGSHFCLSLGEDDAIATGSVKLGGASYAINADTVALNSLLGVAGSLLGTAVREVLLADQVLFTVPDSGAVLAGIPTLELTLSGLGGFESLNCALPLLQLGCDPILFIGLGRRPAGQSRWDLIDDQLTPVRGFGTHSLEMTGVAERLAPGDEIGLLIYAFHAQYPVTWSRDLLVPALGLRGSVQVPLLNEVEIFDNDV